jgi:membrane associated rhomboid family serine protease
VIGLWFVEQLFAGLGAPTPEAGAGIAYWAHVGGFITGIILIVPSKSWVTRPPQRVQSYWG